MPVLLPHQKSWVFKTYTWLCLTIFSLWMTILSPLIILPVKFFGERGRGASHWGFRLWGYLFYFFAVRFRVSGRTNIPASGQLLIICNHNSFLDSPGAFVAIPRPFKVLGKVEMTRYPVFGSLYKVACLLVDRHQATSRSRSLVAIAKEVEKGKAILVFPEGQMNKTGHGLQHFHLPVFQMAQRRGWPVLPVKFSNTYQLLPSSGPFVMRPGVARVEIKPLLNGADFTNGEELKSACMAALS